ncbi:hypothetical protein DGN16_03985 [Xanthomonas citri pv. fuscans]|nr:hypothetical protein DGN16_03985 [Xanthomonas citri pv. fuscans]
MAVGCWLLAVGCWLLAVGCWLLADGCWLMAVGCWLLAVGCWLLAIGCWLLSPSTCACAVARSRVDGILTCAALPCRRHPSEPCTCLSAIRSACPIPSSPVAARRR